MLAKLLAGILGLMAFFLCISGGLLAGTRAEVAIGRSLKAMLLFCLLGYLLGWAAESAIHEHVRTEAQKALAKTSEQTETDDAGNGPSASPPDAAPRG